MNYKDLPQKELEKWFKNISFPVHPFKHQLSSMAFTLGESLTKTAYLHDIGTGKTLTAIYTLKCWNPRGKILIVCPGSIIQSWSNEIQKVTSFKPIILTGERESRKRLLSSRNRVFIINYEGLRILFMKNNPYKMKRNSAKKIVDWDAIKAFGAEAIVFDESHRVKDVRTQQSKTARALSSRSRYSIIMSGTPVGRSIIDLFSQFLILDGGITLGDNLMDFLNTYFYKTYFDWIPKRICNICGEWYDKKKEHLKSHNISLEDYRKKHGKEFTTEKVILDRIGERCIRFSKEECLDLPEKTYSQRYVNLTEEQTKEMKQALSELPGEITLNNLETSIQKLIEITGGFVLIDKKPIRFKSNPKIRELENILPEISKKCIIYHYYVYESKLISESLARNDKKFSVINGTIPLEKRNIEIQKFLEDPKVQFLVAHPKVGGEGLNLQIASTIVYYSRGFIGYILRQQSEGRIHRVGQTNSCHFIDIIMENSIDQILYEGLMEKDSKFQKVLQYLLNTKKHKNG